MKLETGASALHTGRGASSFVARRTACALLAPLLAGLPLFDAVAEQPAPPRITGRAAIGITIGNAEPRTLTIGLFGDAAPKSVALFESLCRGSNPDGLTYRDSTGTRVEKDRAIVLGHLSSGSAQRIDREIDATGYVRSTLVNLADAYTNDDANELSHDRAGLVSMRRGGGEFEFVLTPAANPALDASRVVVGEVIAGADVLAALNAVPARKPSSENEVGGLIYALGAYDESKYLAVAKAGGDPRSRIDQAYRPLQKIRIVSAEMQK